MTGEAAARISLKVGPGDFSLLCRGEGLVVEDSAGNELGRLRARILRDQLLAECDLLSRVWSLLLGECGLVRLSIVSLVLSGG